MLPKIRKPIVYTSHRRPVKGALWGWHIPIMNGYIAHSNGPSGHPQQIMAGITYSAYDFDDLPFVDLPETPAQAEADVKDTPEGERHHLRSIVPCVNGMHASRRFIDAMFYTDYGLGHRSVVSRVRLWGSLVEKDTDPGMGGGNFAGRHLKVVACANLPSVALRFWGLLIRAALACETNSQYPEPRLPGSYRRSMGALLDLARIAKTGNVRGFQQTMDFQGLTSWTWAGVLPITQQTAMTWPGVMTAFRTWQESFRALYIRRLVYDPRDSDSLYNREATILAARRRAEDRLNRVFESILKRELGCK